MGLVDDLKYRAGCLDSETKATADLLYRAADAIAAAEARIEDLENRFCQAHRGDVKASHDCAYCGLYIDDREEGGE